MVIPFTYDRINPRKFCAIVAGYAAGKDLTLLRRHTGLCARSCCSEA